MKEAFLKIEQNKGIELNCDAVVRKVNIDDQNDFIELDIEENNVLFGNLTLIKGETYPLPKIEDTINIKKIYFNLDRLFNFKVFAQGKTKPTLKSEILLNIHNEVYSFEKNKVLESLKKLFDIKENIFTNLFRVDMLYSEEKYYVLLCLGELKEYKINASNIPFQLKKNEFILISNYSINESSNEIIFNKITLMTELNEEELFIYIDSYYRQNTDKLLLFKIIDINEKYFMLINRFNDIYKLQKTKDIETSEIKLCSLILIKNDFKSISYPNKQIKEMIIFNKNTIFYVSKQEIYFSNLIQINFINVIQINFLDYNSSKNYFKEIIISGKQFCINNNELYCPFYKPTQNDLFSEEITLQIEEKDHRKSSFNCFIYRGLLNKINAFANYYSKKSFFYEFYFMCIDEPLVKIKTNTNIKINEKQYELKTFDTFQSLNRKRINVLNIPYQELEDFDEKELIKNKINSIQICKIYQNKKSMIFGIFNIKEDLFIAQENDNSKFDPFYEEFGDVMTIIESINYNAFNKNKIDEICKRYNNSKIEKSEDFILSIYNDELTLSQFKTRVGLALSYFIYQSKKEKEIINVIIYYNLIRMNLLRMKLTLLQQFRIIILFLRKKIEDPSSLNELIYFPDCPKKSPYLLAKELNENEIINLSEFSRSFAAYLQIDSFIMYNYLKNENSYTFSLELLFVMKYLLLSNYEDFIFTSRQASDEFAYNTYNENITVINEANIFPADYQNLDDINNIEESRNYAVPISFEFRHEKNSHQKKKIKNKNSFSPFLYYRDGKFEKGESSKMVESFISEKKEVINDFKQLHIFGELLFFNYYIEKDFSNLLNKMKIIKSKNSKKIKVVKLSTCEAFDKKENPNEKRKEISTEQWNKKLEKQGIIRIGDIHYTKYEIEKLLKNSNKHH